MTSPSEQQEPAAWFGLEIWNGVERMSRLNLQSEPHDLDVFSREFSLSAWNGRTWDQHRDIPSIRKFFREFP